MSSQPTLRAPLPDDYSALFSWINVDKESFRIWAGPVMPFPPSLATLARDLDTEDKPAFVLARSPGPPLGFGQLMAKEDHRAHLVRIIVSPDIRGQGLGESLCTLLMDEAAARWGSTCFSLNVLASNGPAIRLYQRLGFESAAPPSDSALDGQHLYMTLNAGRHR